MGVTTAEGWVRGIAIAVIDGGAAGDHTVPGPLNAADDLISVRHLTVDFVTNADITAEFTITGPELVNNAAGTDTTGDFIVLTWAEGDI